MFLLFRSLGFVFVCLLLLLSFIGCLEFSLFWVLLWGVVFCANPFGSDCFWDFCCWGWSCLEDLVLVSVMRCWSVGWALFSIWICWLFGYFLLCHLRLEKECSVVIFTYICFTVEWRCGLVTFWGVSWTLGPWIFFSFSFISFLMNFKW